MGEKKSYIVLLLVLVAIYCLSETNSPLQDVKWNLGDKWEVDTTLYSRGWMLPSGAGKDKNIRDDVILDQYVITIEVTSRNIKKGVECWQIDFTPSSTAMVGIRNLKYRVWISVKNKKLVDVSQLSGVYVGSPQIEEIDGVRMITNTSYGIPLEIFQSKKEPCENQKNDSGMRNKISTTINNTIIDNLQSIKVEVFKGTNKISHVIQKWDGKQHWWIEYEKQNKGHKEIHAKLKKSMR